MEDAAPGRPNVIGIARGSGGGRTLLLNAHTDTVGVAGMERPHEPRVENGCLFGRGAYDMKAGLAASMLAVASARGLAGDVVLAAVADEEAAGSGTKALLASGLRVDAAIVTEPTETQRRDRTQGLRRLRDRDGRPRRARLPPRTRDRRDRPHGAGARRALSPRGTASQRRGSPAPRAELAPRLADRRRPGVLQLSRAMRTDRRVADAPRTVARRRRGRASRS